MNIKRVKDEIKNTIKAYLAKDQYGNYKIPLVRQRPILLIGPPGIGKTAIMEQVARECGIGLSAYTMTHHTRQSAIGLPFIEHKVYGGEDYAVTEYTMSEILAAVYDKIEETNISEGILFLDEINCVSETLAPTMLQFLQCKTFGNRKVPEGWIIAAAGNPPEYNKSVRDFDVVTLDRVKKIDVFEDYEVWKEYAYKNQVHGAIISYLDIKKENFYQIETTVDGKQFVTARGWEDLSEIIKSYEELLLPVDEEVTVQYIQHKKIAKDFANYLSLYNKYKDDYHIDQVLAGQMGDVSISRLQEAPFDEKLSVIGLLISRLSQEFHKVYVKHLCTTMIFEDLKELKAGLHLGNDSMEQRLWNLYQDKSNKLEHDKKAALLSKDDETILQGVIYTLEQYHLNMRSASINDLNEAFLAVKGWFSSETAKREELITKTRSILEYAFDFIEGAFGESQEMVIFITELTSNYYSMKFISDYGSDRYYKYNKGLLFQEKQNEIMNEIKDKQGELNLI